jgi:hypothetical protein
VAGIVPLQAVATDTHGVTRVDFYVGSQLMGQVTSPPYVLNWDSHLVPNGSHTLTTRAYDAAGYSATSAAVTVTVAQPGSAVYDSALGVPACAEVSNVCDSSSLVKGRGAVVPELHAPNTLDGCTDGVGQSWQDDQIYYLKVSRVDGAAMAAGRRVQVDVGVEINSPTYDAVDLFYASDANSPSWTFLTTLRASATGLQVLSTDYVLPVGGLQAVRARLRHSESTLSPCSSGGLDDHDDLVFAVGPLLDVTPPTAEITSPASNDAVRGTLTVTAVANDDYSVTKVEFYDGSTLLGTDSTAPYSLTFSTVGLPEGNHTLTVKAYDIADHVTTSAPVTVMLDNTLPTASITAPTSTYSRGTVQVTATASDNRGVERVEFYDGSTLLGTDSTAPYSVSWNTTAVSNGGHTLYAKAYDAAGNVYQDFRGVTVDNAAPTVAITSPANGAGVFLSTTIQATASDNNVVQQVAFYDGSTLLGTDTTAPYSFSWNTTLVARGQHTLTARATDYAGNVSISAPVYVTVQ